MNERRRWTREELLLALHLYQRIPFGQQHQSNPKSSRLLHQHRLAFAAREAR